MNNIRADTTLKLFGIVATFAAGVSGAFFSGAQLYKSWVDYNKSVKDGCMSNYKSLIEFAEKTTKKDYEIKGSFATLLKDCYSTNEINQLLNLARKSDLPIIAPPQNIKDYIPEKWVAVGFLPNDFNFAPKGKAILKDLKKDDVITAATDVYIRKGVANWSNPIGIKKEGDSVKIIETRSIQVGQLLQIWARIE